MLIRDPHHQPVRKRAVPRFTLIILRRVGKQPRKVLHILLPLFFLAVPVFLRVCLDRFDPPLVRSDPVLQLPAQRAILSCIAFSVAEQRLCNRFKLFVRNGLAGRFIDRDRAHVRQHHNGVRRNRQVRERNRTCFGLHREALRHAELRVQRALFVRCGRIGTVRRWFRIRMYDLLKRSVRLVFYKLLIRRRLTPDKQQTCKQ